MPIVNIGPGHIKDAMSYEFRTGEDVVGEIEYSGID